MRNDRHIASRAAVVSFIAKTRAQLALYNQVRAILVEYEGKKITARIATAIEKKLPGVAAQVKSPYSWYSLDVWGDGAGLKWADRLDLGLRYHSRSDTFNLEEFDDFNRRYSLDVDRIPEYEKTLAAYDQLVAEFEHAAAAYDVAREALGCIRYDIAES